MSVMGTLCGYVLCLFLGALAVTIIVWIWTGKIDLSALINEANGQASMSRFQLLIFTFVIAISLFVLVEKRTDTLPDVPPGVLTLLGISASTYAVGKGISYSQPQTLNPQLGGGGTEAASDAADAAAAAQAAASQAAVHAATAQQAVQQTASNAAIAQQAASQATGNPPV